jgi:hypothetical protein
MDSKRKTEAFTFEDLTKRYQAMTVEVYAECVTVTDMVGGQPAGDKEIEAFVRHQMKVTDPQAVAEEVARIKAHELGTVRPVAPEGAELDVTEKSAVNLIRRDDHGPWLGDWMVKACIKNSSSRIGIFRQKIGTKGDMAEMGQVRAAGVSCFEIPGADNLNRIYLRNSAGNGPAPTNLETFRGKVSTPNGAQSILTVAEVAAPGARFEFSFRFFDAKTTIEDVADIFSGAMIIGLGSARSLERGKFRIERLTVAFPESKRAKKEVSKKDLDAAAERVESAVAEPQHVNGEAAHA